MLDATADGVRLCLPTTISPRYIPAAQAAGMDPSELDHLTPPVARGGVPYGLRIDVAYAGASPLRGIECPSHPVSIDLDRARAAITWPPSPRPWTRTSCSKSGRPIPSGRASRWCPTPPAASWRC
ncbi:MAG: hypothetical protein IPH09_12805 [bacterium]|nr:hypothetical protein [bacterium]